MPKFAHATDTAWSELWQDWHRCQQEEDRASDEEDAAADALPGWAKEVRRKRAGYEGKPPDTPAARAAAELDTPEYRAACAGLDAATQRYSDCGDVLTEVEERILATPAHNSAGVLVKLRIGIRDIILNYADTEGRMPAESEIGTYCRMVLAALADLESLAGADIGPDQTALRQRSATAGYSGMSTGVKGEFLALVEELDDIKDVASNMVPGAAYYVLVERVKELDEEMLETRAGTLAGVVWKLKELTRLLDNEPDISVFERRLANSALTDVETLAGEA